MVFSGKNSNYLLDELLQLLYAKTLSKINIREVDDFGKSDHTIIRNSITSSSLQINFNFYLFVSDCQQMVNNIVKYYLVTLYTSYL